MHCKAKMATNAKPAPPAIDPAAAAPSRLDPSVKETRPMTDKGICEAEYCNTPIYMTNPTRLCKIHEMDNRHRMASAQKPTPSFKPIPKAFNKSRLYTIRPDKEMKEDPSIYKKRKRDEPTVVPVKRRHTPADTQRLLSQASKEKDRYSNDAFRLDPVSLYSANYHQSSVSVSSGDLPYMNRGSPLYKDIHPLSSTAGDVQNQNRDLPTVTTDDAGERAGAVVDHNGEILATIVSSKSSSVGLTFSNEDTTPINDILSTEEQEEMGIHDYSMEDRPEDYIMDSKESFLGGISESLENGPTNLTLPPIPSLSKLVSSSTLQPEISLPNVATSSDKYEGGVPSVEGTASVEVGEQDIRPPTADKRAPEQSQRQQHARTDSSSLDRFLSQPPARRPSSSEGLNQNQLWGHVDPREVWPQHLTEEWREAKQREIEARGGRKANYKKLLTSQVRKERAERGWGIHQDKDADDDEKWADATQALEELFGLKDTDELVPGVRDGQLVMVEEDIDKDGRRRRKPKVYPVA